MLFGKRRRHIPDPARRIEKKRAGCAIDKPADIGIPQKHGPETETPVPEKKMQVQLYVAGIDPTPQFRIDEPNSPPGQPYEVNRILEYTSIEQDSLLETQPRYAQDSVNLDIFDNDVSRTRIGGASDDRIENRLRGYTCSLLPRRTCRGKPWAKPFGALALRPSAKEHDGGSIFRPAR
jgi:hypothetical protein